jgi:nucleolar complex protein 2
MPSTNNDIETSDDDFIDPSIEKYFEKQKNKKLNPDDINKINLSKEVGEEDDDFEASDYEEDESEEEKEEEEEEEEEDSDIDEYEKIEKQAEDANDDDEDDNEDQNGDTGRKKLTIKMIDKWSQKLGEDKPLHTIFEVVKAFKSALINIVPSKKPQSDSSYHVGSDLFNAMVRLCIRDLFPCLLKLLDLKHSSSTENGSTNKLVLASTGANWKRLKNPIKTYIESMLTVKITCL